MVPAVDVISWAGGGVSGPGRVMLSLEEMASSSSSFNVRCRVPTGDMGMDDCGEEESVFPRSSLSSVTLLFTHSRRRQVESCLSLCVWRGGAVSRDVELVSRGWYSSISISELADG